MCSIPLYVCYLLIVTVVSEEIITFKQDGHVVCVATDRDINSPIYLQPSIHNVPKPVNEFQCFEENSKNISCSKEGQNGEDVLHLLAKSDTEWKAVSRKIDFITDQRWEDFKIEKNVFNFTKLKENKSGSSLYYECKNVRNTSNSNLETTPETSFWKLHQLNFIFAIKKSENNSSIVIYHTGNLCVFMLVYLDQNGILNITLESNGQNNSTSIKKQQTWKKIQIQIDSVNNATLSIWRDQKKQKTQGYWAIHEIKFYTQTIRTSELELPESSLHTCTPLTNEQGKANCNLEKFEKVSNLTCEDIFHEDHHCKSYTICMENNYLWSTPRNNSSKTDKQIQSNSYPGICKSCSKIEECKSNNTKKLTTLSSNHTQQGGTKSTKEGEKLSTVPSDPARRIKTTKNTKTDHFHSPNKDESSIEKTVPITETSRTSTKPYGPTSRTKATTKNANTDKFHFLNKDKSSTRKTTPITKTSRTNRMSSQFFSSSSSKEFNEPMTTEATTSTSSQRLQQKLENFTLMPSDDKLTINWKHLTIDSLSISLNATQNNPENWTKETINNCRTLCSHTIQVQNNITYAIRVEEYNSKSVAMDINITTYELSQLSSKPMIEFCVYHCKLLIPKPSNTTNFSNFSISVTTSSSNINAWEINNLIFENDYFLVDIGPGKAVSLRNKTYSMYLHVNHRKYPLFSISEHTSSGFTNYEALVCLILVLISTIIFLVYLTVAYKLKMYPFELLKLPKRKNWSLEDVTPFSEHYRRNSLKRVRSKADVPKEPELTELMEPTSEQQVKNLTKLTSVPIVLGKFEEYLMKSLEDDPYSNALTIQYRKIQAKVDKPCTVGLQNNNVGKNRYKNLIAYDDTRVVLTDSDSDYINANYVDGYENARAFIATQAPTRSTLSDFWLMIWQEQVTCIIMLTELVESGTVKCEQYWPDPQQKARYGKILIKTIATKNFSDYADQQFQVTCGDETRIIRHLQYKTWPDHGVPLYPQNFTPFVKRLLAMPQRNSPIVVHCNAGCGRTGTLILCDILLRMAAKEKSLDFVKVLTKMRQQRAHLVNNVNQYVFAHFVVLECLFGVDFSIQVNDSFQDEVWKVLRKHTVKPLMEELDKVMHQFRKRQISYTSTLTEEDKKKNRFSDILPGHTQIYLPMSSKNPSNYINAVCVDCYRCPKKFIVTQQPLPNTLKDFWTMIKEYTVNTIVSLNEIDEEDPNCPRFWLFNDQETKIEIQEEVDERIYSITKVKITDATTEKTVNILKMKNWTKETPSPLNPKDLILTWKKTFDSSWKGDSQIVVTCYDGALASGLFVALAYLLEKINYEQSCDVFSAVRTVRQSREQFVQEWGQFEFLYKAAKVYIEEFDNYDNFGN